MTRDMKIFLGYPLDASDETIRTWQNIGHYYEMRTREVIEPCMRELDDVWDEFLEDKKDRTIPWNIRNALNHAYMECASSIIKETADKIRKLEIDEGDHLKKAGHPDYVDDWIYGSGFRS